MVETLIQIRRLLEGGWTRGSFGRDGNRSPVDPRRPSACYYCLVGAIYKVTGDWRGARPVIGMFLGLLGGRRLVEWNDEPERTAQDVLDIVDEAIAIARRRAAA